MTPGGVLALVSQIAPEILAVKAGSLVSLRLPVDIDEIVRIMAIEVIIFDLPDSISGVYTEIAGQPYIGLNSKQSMTRRRFTIAHELYHFLTDFDSGEIAAMIESTRGLRLIEAYANKFAALLLMPEQPMRSLWAKGICQKHLAEIFDVSEQAMQIRMKDLGLKTMSRKTSSHNHCKSYCCELAKIQYIAWQPYLETSLSSIEDEEFHMPVRQ